MLIAIFRARHMAIGPDSDVSGSRLPTSQSLLFISHIIHQNSTEPTPKVTALINLATRHRGCFMVLYTITLSSRSRQALPFARHWGRQSVVRADFQLFITISNKANSSLIIAPQCCNACKKVSNAIGKLLRTYHAGPAVHFPLSYNQK